MQAIAHLSHCRRGYGLVVGIRLRPQFTRYRAKQHHCALQAHVNLFNLCIFHILHTTCLFFEKNRYFSSLYSILCSFHHIGLVCSEAYCLFYPTFVFSLIYSLLKFPGHRRVTFVEINIIIIHDARYSYVSATLSFCQVTTIYSAWLKARTLCRAEPFSLLLLLFRHYG